MEQTWGKMPQTAPAFAEGIMASSSPALNIKEINDLDAISLPRGWPDWHTNCFLLPQREILMTAQRRVLIIDPDPKERQDLARSLREEPYFIDTGKSLSEAIKKVSGGGFDCLIMDINLPEMKGYEAVPILKHLDPELKIIMTTRKNTKPLEAKVREQDIFFYFIKSFGKHELRLALKSAFNP
jgi:CheY-like chemotaxis protein